MQGTATTAKNHERSLERHNLPKAANPIGIHRAAITFGKCCFMSYGEQ
jgi:hypothetical protein